MVLNLVAIVFLITCDIVLGNGQSTIGENELFDFKQKMAVMEENMAKQEFRISSLEDQLKIRDIEIKDLKDKVMKLGPKIQNVEKNVTSLQQILMRIKPVEHENKMIPLEDETKENSVHIRTEGDGNGLQGVNRLFRRVVSQPIAFYAYMSSDEKYPSKHHTLVFDAVKTNTGNGYNKYTGLFTAPISGLYVFTSSIIMDGSGAYASYDIITNADIEGTFFVDAEDNSEYHSSSITVVVSLNAGDVIFVRTSSTYTPHGSIFSRPIGRSSVAGWRIQ